MVDLFGEYDNARILGPVCCSKYQGSGAKEVLITSFPLTPVLPTCWFELWGLCKRLLQVATWPEIFVN